MEGGIKHYKQPASSASLDVVGGGPSDKQPICTTAQRRIMLCCEEHNAYKSKAVCDGEHPKPASKHHLNKGSQCDETHWSMRC